MPAPEAGGTAWLWPDNVAAWHHWCNLHTQWQHAPQGMGGSRPMGLCYAGVTAYLQAHGYRTQRRGPRSLPAMLALIQACEAGALQGIAVQIERSAAKR